MRVDISELDKERGGKAWEIYLLHYSRHPREDEHRVPAEIAAWLTREANQHLIDAARLEGIRLGLEAAAREIADREDRAANCPDGGGEWLRTDHMQADIRAIDPETIAKEADQ